jgi:hypothetical protein
VGALAPRVFACELQPTACGQVGARPGHIVPRSIGDLRCRATTSATSKRPRRTRCR